jgi:hypothetical protein
MIGSRPDAGGLSRRALLAGTVVTLGLAVLFGQRPVDPALADPPRAAAYRGQVEATAGEAAASLDALATTLEAAIDLGRQGAARTLSGDEPPGRQLRAAARLVRDAAPQADLAGRLLRELEGVLAASWPPRDGPGALVSGVELEAVAVRLDAAADAADQFVELRWATEATLEALERAIATLEDDPDAALRATGEARAALVRIESWRIAREGAPSLPTLPIWAATAGRLTDAVAAMAEATLAHDPAAVDEAARAYREVAPEARRADQALGIALAEGGGAVSASALASLADTLAATDATIAVVAEFARA